MWGQPPSAVNWVEPGRSTQRFPQLYFPNVTNDLYRELYPANVDIVGAGCKAAQS
jgi:hypothetical protein